MRSYGFQSAFPHSPHCPSFAYCLLNVKVFVICSCLKKLIFDLSNVAFYRLRCASQACFPQGLFI